MKIASAIETPAMRETGAMQVPIKVCMYVLRKASTDYRALRSATKLVEEGFEVSIVDIACERRLPGEEHIAGIHIKHTIIPNWFRSRRFQPWFFLVAMQTFVLSLVKLMRSQADIYHAVELTALPVCYIVAKLRRKPLIYEAYELHVPAPETDIAFWRRSGKLLMHLFSFVLPRCAGVITTTPCYAEVLQKRFHIPTVTVLRNILPYRTVQKGDLLRQKLGLNSNTRIALYQGGLQRNRGLDNLIRAAAFLEQNIVIVLMGKGMGTTQKELEALIASEGVTDRVKIIPPVPNYEDLLDWTASADIGLITYTPGYSLAVKLILPNKLFEYVMAGVPVLATQLDAVVEIIKTYDVGHIVPSAMPSAIGSAINRMLADPIALTRMRHNALKAAQEDLYWEKESQSLTRLYRSIVDLNHKETMLLC